MVITISEYAEDDELKIVRLFAELVVEIITFGNIAANHAATLKSTPNRFIKNASPGRPTATSTSEATSNSANNTAHPSAMRLTRALKANSPYTTKINAKRMVIPPEITAAFLLLL